MSMRASGHPCVHASMASLHTRVHSYIICTGCATIQVDANGAPMRQKGCVILFCTPNYCLKTRKHVLVMYCTPPLYCTIMY